MKFLLALSDVFHVININTLYITYSYHEYETTKEKECRKIECHATIIQLEHKYTVKRKKRGAKLAAIVKKKTHTQIKISLY